MTELLVLDKIASISGKNDKRAILEANAGNTALKELLDAALNYKRRFFIKKWEDQPAIPTGLCKHQEFMLVLNDLESQKYRGDRATEMVEEFMRSCTRIQQEWYSKIIRKDLKAGFGIDSAIACGFDIPLFEVQLAKDGKECKRLPQMIKDGLLASRKYDGYRCLAVVDSSDESVVLYTRNGEVLANFPAIEDSLRKLFMDTEHNSKYVFDGEIMSDNFQSMQKSAFASKRGTTVGDVVYHIFDMIPYDEWISEKFTTKAFARYKTLDMLFGMAQAKMAHNNITNLVTINRVKVESFNHILELEKQYIAEGFEGVMTNPDIPYYKGKSSNKMLKFKTFLSMDCKVESAYKGEKGSKYEHTLGGFTVEQENGVICDVGGGYDDSERDEMWGKCFAFIGRVMEVKYQELTQDDKRMRFPVFVRWRNDKENK